MADDSPSFKVNQSDELELSYRLEYKSAEVKRLADSRNFSHVTTAIGPGAPAFAPAAAAAHFSKVTETVAVTTDDQVIKFTTRVIAIPLDQHVMFPVTALYNDGSGKPAPGAEPVTVMSIEILRPGWSS